LFFPLFSPFGDGREIPLKSKNFFILLLSSPYPYPQLKVNLMAKTKKVGISGKFATRYGAKVRKEWNVIAEKQKGFSKCPKCETKARNMRDYVGLWHCEKCGATWTGGAWESATPRGKESHRIATRLAREMAEAEQKKAA